MISPGGQAELLLLPADVCLGTDCQLPVGGKNAACLLGSHLSLSLSRLSTERIKIQGRGIEGLVWMTTNVSLVLI